ncbi:MAG: hypothetical protein ABW172_03155 [Candidatus Binatia bacterium]
MRLYPVLYRQLPVWQQFDKYDVIELDVRRRPAYKDKSPGELATIFGHLKSGEKSAQNKGNWDVRLD